MTLEKEFDKIIEQKLYDNLKKVAKKEHKTIAQVAHDATDAFLSRHGIK